MNEAMFFPVPVFHSCDGFAVGRKSLVNSQDTKTIRMYDFKTSERFECPGPKIRAGRVGK